MTWTYEIADDGSELTIRDHTGSFDRTIPNDGSGFEPKKEVLQAIEERAVGEHEQNGVSPVLIQLLRDAIFRNIEEVSG